jgi:hypothetical protein
MKRRIYKLLTGAKHGLFALALTVFSGTAYSQTTYTFNYTGSTQTISLPPGNYSIQCWGADGGNATNGSVPMSGGKGGYSTGIFTNTATAVFNVYVGGHGGNASGASNLGGGGGGMSDVAPASNTNIIIIAAGGGGGATSGSASEASTGGGGGGLVGGTAQDGTGVSTGTAASGGSQTSGGVAQAGSYGAGSPGGFGYGGGAANGGTAGVMHAAGGAGGNGGSGGWNGGGGGCTSTSGNDHSAGGGAGYYGGGGGRGDGGAGGGGSGYIGGVSSGTTIMFGQSGFVTNPDATGNGMVLIKDLCSISLSVTGVNSGGAMCAGSSVTLTTNAVSNYSWSTGASTSSIVVAPTANTVYALSATSSQSCTGSNQVSITVSSGLPVLSVTQSTTSTCLGNTVSVNATGALTYTWTNSIQNNIPFTPTSGTNIYTVTGQNGCGTSTSVATVTVAPLPVNGVATPSVICENSTTTLTVSGAATYTWLPTNQTGSNIVSSASVSTIYTVTGVTGSCSGVHTVMVNTKPNPTLSIAGTGTTVCMGNTVGFTVTGADTYTWVQANLTGSVVVDTPTAPTLYQVSGTNSVGCTSSANYIVVPQNPPAMTTNLSSTTICEGGTVTLSAGVATSFTWSTGPNTNAITVSPATSSVYTVIGGHSSNSCTISKSFSVDVAHPVLGVSQSTAICMGAVTSLSAGPGQNFNWSHGGGAFPTLSNISPAVTTIYTVTADVAVNNIVCPASATVQVTVNPNPTITVAATRTAICRNEPVQLTASGASTYVWSNTQTGATITYSSSAAIPQNLSVVGTDANGCTTSGSILLMVSSCNGLSDFGSNAAIEIYPNPSSGTFSVKGAPNMIVSLRNALGQSMGEPSVTDASGITEFRGLAPGVYFLVALHPGGNAVHTVVVR